MLLHIPDNGPFACNVTVPCLNCGVNFCLGSGCSENWCRLLNNSRFFGDRFRYDRRFCRGRFCKTDFKGMLPTAIFQGGNDQAVLLLKLGCKPFQILYRNPTHLSSASSGNSFCGEGQIQHGSDFHGIFSVDFIEVTHLIQHDFIGMIMLDIVIVPDGRFFCRGIDCRFYFLPGSFLCGLGCYFCILGLFFGKIFLGEVASGGNKVINILGNLFPV